MHIVGVPPSAILGSLRARWGLVDSIVTVWGGDVVIWAADVRGGHDKKDRRIARIARDVVRDRIALCFYDAELRDDPALRRSCSDRHVLDGVIDRWKAGQRLDGSKVSVGRADIVFSLRMRWKLIDSRVTEENIIIWTADVAGRGKKARRVARIVEKIRHSREKLEEDQNGIVVDRFEEWEGKVCRLGERLARRIEIRNDSNVDVLCTVKGDVARQRGFVIDGDLDFELRGGCSREIVVSFRATQMGVKKSIISFDFRSIDFNDDENSVDEFTIVRYIHLRVGDPDDYDILKPSSPYAKTKNRFFDGDKFSNPERVVQHAGTTAPFAQTLAKYPIPPELLKLAAFERDAIVKKFDGMFRGEDEEFVDARYEKIDYSSYLNVKKYAICMKNLLWMEEFQMRVYFDSYFLMQISYTFYVGGAVDIKTYDLVNAPLLREGRAHYKLLVPGLAESRPSVLRGDKILIRDTGGSKYEGVVHRTSQEYAIMDLPRSFDRTFIDGLRVDVRFTFSRTTLRTSHQALAKIAETTTNEESQLGRTMFPRLMGTRPLNAMNARIIRPNQLNYYNRTLNQEQQTAVVGIVQSVARPAPYLIYGPPGTGKTVTLVESILQTILAAGSNPDSKILVCAPSNTAVDVVVERLSVVITEPRQMLRLVAFSRDKATVPDNILKYANYDEDKDCFTNPEADVIKRYQIVAVTTSYAGRLPNLGVLHHFTHVFIDEAGHSVECEAIGCLALTTKQSTSNPPVTVLAGDPKQLGPIIRNDIAKAFGLEKSLLERLSQLEPYARSEESDSLGNHYNTNMITKLVRNYRSHSKILDIPNRTFYDGDLIAEAEMIRSHRFVDWEHLPQKGFPIIFHGVEGEDMREANSPSWFNPDEAQYVKMYVDLLVKDTRKNRCKPEDIGIIAPYHKQVQKIRMILGAHGYKDCKVGSVEEFQGSERPVIIISTVRSTVDYIQFDKTHKLGFLANEKRFNVAVTRAQSLLIMIGNPLTLENDSNWESMIDYVINGGGYTGVEYKKKDPRNNAGSSIENVIRGIHVDNSDDEDTFVGVSHVAGQEGPAWRSEE
ncbi:hypothetical protein ACHAW5_000336 [Stephanodiscus triporus]|uniref:RNA helicase n=1 Tax=Stephanodiscus triporus TaxID=2934178 RepID=A0ABD3NNC7_9STRA